MSSAYLNVEYIPWIDNPVRDKLGRVSRTFQRVIRDLAANLRRIRIEAGMSQEHLALSAGVDRTYVSQIERGVGNPSVQVVVRLASTLRVDIDQLLGS